jgi:hypothetical protein
MRKGILAQQRKTEAGIMKGIKDPSIHQRISQRFTTDRGRVDASGAGSFFRLANAVLIESLASTHRSRSGFRETTPGSASSGKLWSSVTMTHDEGFSSSVFKPRGRLLF